MIVTKIYCDKCGKEFVYPVIRKLYLSGIGREGGYELCDSCYNQLYSWFNENKKEISND